jgi:hypothetical protein
MHAPMQCCQNTLAYFAIAVSYMRKMFMQLSPEGIALRQISPRLDVIKLFTDILHECSL